MAALTLVVDYCYADVVRLETRVAVLRRGERIGETVLPAAETQTGKFAQHAAVEISDYLSSLPSLKEEVDDDRHQLRSVVAVLGIEDDARSVPGETLSQLTDYLSARSVEVLGWSTLPPAEIRERLRAEKKASYAPCMDDACQIELGKALAADKMLATKLLRLGDVCTVVASLYDLRRESAEAAATIESGCASNELRDAIDRLVRELFARLSKGYG